MTPNSNSNTILKTNPNTYLILATNINPQAGAFYDIPTIFQREAQRQGLDQLALSLGKSRSTCVREAIALYVDRFSGGEEAMRQSQLIRQQAGSTHWSEQVPDWTDWTA